MDIGFPLSPDFGKDARNQRTMEIDIMILPAFMTNSFTMIYNWRNVDRARGIRYGGSSIIKELLPLSFIN